MYQSFTLPLIAYILGHRLSATRWMTCTNLPHSLSAYAICAGAQPTASVVSSPRLSTIGITLGVMALVTVLSVMNGFERELQNNILGLMPQAILSAKQGSVNPQQLPEREAKLNGVTRVALDHHRRRGAAERAQRGGRGYAGH